MADNHSDSGLFRKQALEQMSASRPLEDRMRLIARHWWIALATIAFVLIIAALWGWYGRISTKVSGFGMLVQHGEFCNVVSQSDGTVQLLNAVDGMTVKEGDILAVLSLPLEEIELKHYETRLQTMRGDLDGLRQLTERHVSRRTGFSTHILGKSEEIMKDLETLLKQLTSLNQNYRNFRSRGLVTEAETLNVLQNMLNTAISLIRQQQEIADHKMNKMDYEHGFEREFWRKGMEIQQAENELAYKMAQFISRKNIVSHSEGTIVNLEKNVGDHVALGETVCTLQRATGESLVVSALIPAKQSKTVRAGQLVNVSPADTEPYRIGYMLGQVEKVGLFPASMERLINLYKNRDLARMLRGDEAAVPVQIGLTPDSSNSTGFKWTGRAPDNVDVAAGRLCTVQVVVEQRAPLSYVLPYLRKTFLGETQPQFRSLTER